MNKMQNQVTLAFFIIMLLVVTTASVTFAFFKTVIKSSNSSIIATGSAAKLSITYANDSNNSTIVGEKIIPGWSDVKKFTIIGENTNTVNKDLTYDILLVIDTNTFLTGELVYDLQGNGFSISNQIIPTKSEISNGEISLFPTGITKPFFAANSSSSTHSYTLTVKYPYLENEPQYATGKKFVAHVSVESSAQITR